MKALLVNQYFWPDRAATAQLLSDLAEDLVRAGWEVTALAGRCSYAPGHSGKLSPGEAWRGVSVRRVACTDLGRASLARRVCDYATYLLSASAAMLTGPRFDVVVCLSTPPLVAILGLLARWRGTRFVYKVEDLYPDVAVALGELRSGSWLAAALGRLSRRLLSRADAVVALDAGMADALRTRGARRLEVIPNWADGAAIAPDPAAGRAQRANLGLGDRFVVLYSGNLGLAHRFDAVLDAARRLAAQAGSALFLFVGDGVRLAELRAASRELPNVRFLPYQPREALRGLYAAADVHLVTLRDEVAGLLVPSKYAAALAAGKPVLLVGGAATSLCREIEEHRVGWFCPHEGEALAALIGRMRAEPAEAAARGARARELFETRYDRGKTALQWQTLLRSVAAGA